MATTQERLRAAGLRLFSQQGFRGATIGDIEEAAGLVPRAGSFYRYYESKEHLLVDCVETFVKDVFNELPSADELTLGDTRAELLLIGHSLLRIGQRNRELRVLVRREVQRGASLRARAAEINQRMVSQTLLPWLRKTVTRKLTANQERVLALTLFGPVLYYMLEEDMYQEPFGLSRNQFLKAWATYWTDQLTRGSGVRLPGAKPRR